MNTTKHLTQSAIELLKSLIKMPSFSGEEDKTARLINDWLKNQGVPCWQLGNNVIARNREFNPEKPTLLMNTI